MAKRRYTYKLRPGKHATCYLLACNDATRWVWNTCVEKSRAGTPISDKHLCSLLTTWRKDNSWLGNHPVVPQQQAIKDFVTAHRAWVKKQRRAPRFKARKRALPSLNYTARGFTITADRTLKLAGGITIPVVWSRPLPSPPTSVRVYRDSVGWWFASFVVDVDDTPRPRTRDGAVGIDWGVITPATTTRDDLDLAYHPRVRSHAKQLARIQRRMAVHKAAHNWPCYHVHKAKAAKLHRTLRWQRREQNRAWAQKVARTNSIICYEDFHSRFLATTRMAKKASDNAIGMLKRELINAGCTYGCTLIPVNPAYTTMDCSHCGARTKHRIELDVRDFVCESCGIVLDRDKNAARNMLIRAGFNPADDDGVRLQATEAS